MVPDSVLVETGNSVENSGELKRTLVPGWAYTLHHHTTFWQQSLRAAQDMIFLMLNNP